MKTDYFEDQIEDKAIIIGPNEGETLNLDHISITFKLNSTQSNGTLGVYEITLPPNAIGAKLHYHRFMDETFIVNQGTLTLQAGQDIHHAKPGTVAYVPRFTPHGFRNDTNETVRLTLIFNPAQKREGFFRGLYETLTQDPIDPAQFIKLYHKYDSIPIDDQDIIPIQH